MSNETPEVQEKAGRFTFTGWHMLAVILLFFGTIISVNTFMIVKAVKTFPGEDIKQSYRQGLEYNKTLAQRGDQRALNWSADITLESDHIAILNIIDDNGLAIRGLSVNGILKHPSETDMDISLIFTQDSVTGHYSAQIPTTILGKRWLQTKAHYENVNNNAPVFETRNELWLK